MNSRRLNITALAALAGGAVYFVLGAIHATHGDFGGTHNTIDSTAEYIVTGGFAIALFLTASGYRVFGALAGTPRAGAVAMAPQLVIGAMCVVSVINGEDPAFFNAVAPVCVLTWLVSSIVIARGLKRTGAVSPRVAIAFGALPVVTLALSPLGGPLLTGAFWVAVATHALRDGARLPAPATA
jgi:hypothetical protein